MARERGTSLLHSYEEAASFFGPKVPDVVRKMTPHWSSFDQDTLRKFIQVGIKDMEGCDINDNALQSLSKGDVPEELVRAMYAGVLQILKMAFRLPSGALKKEIFTTELAELKIPEEFIKDLTSVIFSSKQQTIEDRFLENRIRLPRLDSLRWRVDVGISTSVLNRVLEPTILMEMKLDDGKTETFEVPVSKFHELRYNVASVLKEMEDLEKRSILKIKT